MSGHDAALRDVLPPADNPFLANDLAKYIPHPKAETWRLTGTRALREAPQIEPKPLKLEEIEKLLPVVQQPMIVVANGRVVTELLPEQGFLQKIGFSVAVDAANMDTGWALGGDVAALAGTEEANGGLKLAQLGQVGLVWGRDERDLLRFEVVDGVSAVAHVVQVSGGDGAPISCPMQVRVASGGHLVVVEHWVGHTDASCWLNAARQVRVAAGGHFEHGIVQTLPKQALLTVSQDVQVAQGGRYSFDAFQAGGAFSRLETDLTAGRDVELNVRALQLTGASGNQTHDVTTRVRLCDRAPLANVKQRNIVRNTGVAVFQGKYHVEQLAQKTDAYMLCENLLLDDGAVVNQKPELEIYADDVKCSHGASTGSLREEQLFYLQARGLSPAAARRLLVSAYAYAPLDEMHPVMADCARELVDRWLEVA